MNIHKRKGKYFDCLEEFKIYTSAKSDPQNLLNEQAPSKCNIIYNGKFTQSTNSRDRDRIAGNIPVITGTNQGHLLPPV